MVQRYEQTRKLQWYKRGAAYFFGIYRLYSSEKTAEKINKKLVRIIWRAFYLSDILLFIG